MASGSISTTPSSGARPYAGAEALYVAASDTFVDASRVVCFVRGAASFERADGALEARARAALTALRARHPRLGTKLGPKGFLPTEAPLSFELVVAPDPHAAALPEAEAEWRAPETASPFGFRLVLPPAASEGGPPGQTPFALLVRGHHAACDGFSLVGLAASFLRALFAAGVALAPEGAVTDVVTVARRELGPSWRRPIIVAKAALALFGRGRAKQLVTLAPPERGTPPLRCRELRLSSHHTERLRASCRARGVTFSGLLVAACALACESTGRVEVGVALDLRRLARFTSLPRTALGLLAGMTDVSLSLAPSRDAWSLAARASASLAASVYDEPALPFATALLADWLTPLGARWIAAGRTVFPQTLLLSNVGECAELFADLTGVHVSSAGFVSSPRGSRKLHVSCASVRGELSIGFAWPDGALSAERVEQFRAALERTLLHA